MQLVRRTGYFAGIKGRKACGEVCGQKNMDKNRVQKTQLGISCTSKGQIRWLALHLGGGAQIGYGICLFPGEFRQFAAKVAVAGRLLIDRALEIKALADESRGAGQRLRARPWSAVRPAGRWCPASKHADGLGHADAIGDLHFAYRCEARGNNVFSV